jgi:glycosyltransferase involved in cell wall biosynthesis
MPTVSVIIPNYNHAPYLQQRIESILNQTYQDFDVIILDDCSTDDSKKIIERYRDNPKISHIIYNETNSSSPFKQWDKGMHLAKGEYIWIAESDDWCEPSLLSTIIEMFNQHHSLVLGYVQSYYIVDDNDIKWVSNQNFLETISNGIDFVKKHLLNGNAIFNASMAVFRKSAYSNLTIDYTKFSFCGDWLFWAGIASQGDVFISGKILNYFRNHNGDVSSKAYSSGYNFIEELQVLFVFLDNNFITDDEFFNALKIKHLDYKFSTNNFTPQASATIETLFYSDKHTEKYKPLLIDDYKRAFKKHASIRTLIKRKIKSGLKKIGL